MLKMSQASGSFLKKSTKKLLLTAGFGDKGATAHGTRRFFAAFFQKTAALTFINNDLI
jgi:hypothetical protein